MVKKMIWFRCWFIKNSACDRIGERDIQIGLVDSLRNNGRTETADANALLPNTEGGAYERSAVRSADSSVVPQFQNEFQAGFTS